MPGRVAIFIDGAYLAFVLRDEFQNARLDFGALSKSMAGESKILRTYYYNRAPYQGTFPNEEERNRYSSFRRFVDALDRQPRYEVRLGRLAFRGNDQSGTPIFEQKQVDILLGVDLVQLAAKRNIQEAVLVAGDNDFIPAVTAAKAEGVLVRLYHGASPHRDLLQQCDERTPFTQSFIDAIRL